MTAWLYSMQTHSCCTHRSGTNESQLCTRGECKTFRPRRGCLTPTWRISTDEGLRGQNVLHSTHVHSCALMVNNLCSEARLFASLYLGQLAMEDTFTINSHRYIKKRIYSRAGFTTSTPLVTWTQVTHCGLK